MGFKIAEYQRGIRNARREFTGGFFGLLRGGPIDADDIISRYYESNRARFNVQKEMFKNISAAGILGVDTASLRKEFSDRQIGAKTFNNFSLAFIGSPISKSTSAGLTNFGLVLMII